MKAPGNCTSLPNRFDLTTSPFRTFTILCKMSSIFVSDVPTLVNLARDDTHGPENGSV